MSNTKSYHAETHHETFEGNHEDMLGQRDKQFKTLKATADKVLKDWTGQPIIIITANDDGKGQVQVRGFDGGVGNAAEQMALIESMHKIEHDLQHNIISTAPSPEDFLAQLLGKK